jgi:hypothetical protein
MKGWTVLRFGTAQVVEQLSEGCIPTIAKTINKLGGLVGNHAGPRRIELSIDGLRQKGLFDES